MPAAHSRGSAVRCAVLIALLSLLLLSTAPTVYASNHAPGAGRVVVGRVLHAVADDGVAGPTRTLATDRVPDAAPDLAPDGDVVERTTSEAVGLVAVEGDVRPAGPPVPHVVPRREWDPAGTCPASSEERTRPQRIHLHHTHIPVVEAPGEVPEAMRSICRQHHERGMSDVAYHYAIDPWGTIWQARGPLPSLLDTSVVTGAHAQGFNDGSIGVVLIGDYDVAPPTAEAMEATTALLAFLSWHFDLDPLATVAAESTGGPKTRFPEGTHVELHAINGHRDTGKDTACPGEHLYARLPSLREAVAGRLATWG